MVRTSNSKKVPSRMWVRYEEVVDLTDKFCTEYLNDEYAELSQRAAAALSRKRPSPLERGALLHPCVLEMT